MKQKIEDKLKELRSDDKNYYPIANVFSNAPLALLQYSLSSKIHLLEELLGMPHSSFPLKKEETNA